MNIPKSSTLKDIRIWQVFAITTIAVMGIAGYMSAFPKIALHFGVTPDKVALIPTLFTLPGLFLAPIFGVLADRYGRKSVILPSLLLFSIAGFSIFFVNDFNYLLVMIFLQGVGAASLGAMNVTLISDYYQGKERAIALGYNGTVLNISTALYPFLGGMLAGIGWNFPFLMPALGLIAFFIVLIFLKEDKSNLKRSSLADNLRTLKDSLKNRHILGIFLVSFLTFFVLFGTLISFLPFLISDLGIKNPIFIGLQISTMSVFAAISSSQLKKWLKYLNQKQLIETAFTLYVMALLSYIAFPNPYLFFISSAIFGIGHGINIPSYTSILSTLVPRENLAGFMSLNRSAALLGQASAPFIFGLIYKNFGISTVFFYGVVASSFAIFAISFFLKKLKSD
jgi:MFS family permease